MTRGRGFDDVMELVRTDNRAEDAFVQQRLPRLGLSWLGASGVTLGDVELHYDVSQQKPTSCKLAAPQ